MSQQPTVPGQGTSDDAFIQQMILQAKANQAGVGTTDQPIVPLWMARPSSPNPSAGSGGPNPIWVQGAQVGKGPMQPSFFTKDAAEAYWLDMSDKEHMTFADAAQKAGFWKPSQGQDSLVSAWGHAVSLAAQYNANKTDQKDWLSPFEAIDKLAVKAMADGDQSHDGFSTQTTYKTFSESDLLAQARSILQDQLGRNPTGSEMKAFTAAANAASRLNPTVTQMQDVTNPDGSKSQVVNVSGGVDQNATGALAQDLAMQAPDYGEYQAATTYYKALMSTLGSAIQL